MALRENQGNLTQALLQQLHAARLTQIGEQIAAIDQEMARPRAKDSAFSRRFKSSKASKALALSAFALLIGMPELGALDAKQVASLGGVALAPGRVRASSRVAAGPPPGVLVAIRYNRDMKTKYEALIRLASPPSCASR